MIRFSDEFAGFYEAHLGEDKRLADAIELWKVEEMVGFSMSNQWMQGGRFSTEEVQLAAATHICKGCC
jgi:hypothetical protein